VEWARKCRETRIERKDAARPLFAFLMAYGVYDATGQ